MIKPTFLYPQMLRHPVYALDGVAGGSNELCKASGIVVTGVRIAQDDFHAAVRTFLQLAGQIVFDKGRVIGLACQVGGLGFPGHDIVASQAVGALLHIGPGAYGHAPQVADF